VTTSKSKAVCEIQFHIHLSTFIVIILQRYYCAFRLLNVTCQFLFSSNPVPQASVIRMSYSFREIWAAFIHAKQILEWTNAHSLYLGFKHLILIYVYLQVMMTLRAGYNDFNEILHDQERGLRKKIFGSKRKWHLIPQNRKQISIHLSVLCILSLNYHRSNIAFSQGNFFNIILDLCHLGVESRVTN